MTKLFMMVGLVGSGKSVYASKLAKEENAVIFSSDAIRGELYGDESIQGDNDLIFQTLHNRLIDSLKAEHNVIYDATNLKSKVRRTFLQQISHIECEKIAVIMSTPFETCRKQNEQRSRVVPYNVLKRMYMNFTVPCKQEGFDDVRILYPDNFKAANFIDLVASYSIIPHDNPHHPETVGTHMQLAYNYFVNNYPDEDPAIGLAAFLHDIGKPFTKVFTNYAGEPTDIAHYYGHNNVGAYEILQLFPKTSTDKLIEMALLVQYHMQYYISWNQSKKSYERDKQFLGDEFMRKLDILHDCDRNARCMMSTTYD